MIVESEYDISCIYDLWHHPVALGALSITFNHIQSHSITLLIVLSITAQVWSVSVSLSLLTRQQKFKFKFKFKFHSQYQTLHMVFVLVFLAHTIQLTFYLATTSHSSFFYFPTHLPIHTLMMSMLLTNSWILHWKFGILRLLFQVNWNLQIKHRSAREGDPLHRDVTDEVGSIPRPGRRFLSKHARVQPS